MKTEKSNIAYHEPQRIDSLAEGEFDALPFGAIKLDAAGRAHSNAAIARDGAAFRGI